MTTPESIHWGRRDDRPWRAELLRAVCLLAAVGVSAVALHWAIGRVLASIAPDASLKFVDAFALTSAVGLIALMLGVAWRFGDGTRS